MPVANEMKPLIKQLFDFDILITLVGLEPSPTALVGSIGAGGFDHLHLVFYQFRKQLAAHFSFDLAFLAV